ncbi:MAG: hypothetical protein P8Y14_07965, partial [Anaerolineales bacterium]
MVGTIITANPKELPFEKGNESDTIDQQVSIKPGPPPDVGPWLCLRVKRRKKSNFSIKRGGCLLERAEPAP